MEVSISEYRNCGDPECDGKAVEELDGDHTYWACETCGFANDYQRVASSEDTCQIGMPIDTLSVAQTGNEVQVQLGTKP